MIELVRDLKLINVLAKFENDPWKIMDGIVLTGLVCPAARPQRPLRRRQYPGALKGCGVKSKNGLHISPRYILFWSPLRDEGHITHNRVDWKKSYIHVYKHIYSFWPICVLEKGGGINPSVSLIAPSDAIKNVTGHDESHLINTSPPSAAYMRQWIGSALVQIMAWRRMGAKSLSEPMLGYWKLDTKEQTSNHYMNQCRSTWLAHICGTRGRWDPLDSFCGLANFYFNTREWMLLIPKCLCVSAIIRLRLHCNLGVGSLKLLNFGSLILSRWDMPRLIVFGCNAKMISDAVYLITKMQAEQFKPS